MHAVALKLLLKSGEHESETREWSKLLDDHQTWTAWKTTFREAYVAKRQSEESREGEDKPFGGSAANDAHDQMCQRGNTVSAVPAPLPNHMLDSIDTYLNSISADATQAFAKGGPLAELSASLAISIDTVTTQQKEIKCLYKHINAMKNKGNQDSRIGKTAGGGMTGNVCPHYAAVGCTPLHKKN